MENFRYRPIPGNFFTHILKGGYASRDNRVGMRESCNVFNA